MATRVYFATNRNPIVSSVPNNFGTDFSPDGPLQFGRAVLQSVKDESELGNSNLAIDNIAKGDFSDALKAEIVGSDVDHLLITFHGFDYRFREAVMRAGFLNDWYGRGKPKLASTVIAFSWPSLGSLTVDAYRTDYRNATASSGAFRRFLLALLPLIKQFRAISPKRRVSIMAHSMGNHFLHAGLMAAIGKAPGQITIGDFSGLIDRGLLIACDEDADALSSGGGLGSLLDISQQVVLYYNNQDLPLTTISRVVHGTGRLGIDGPYDKKSFAGRNISFVNCSAANPELPNEARLDPQWHQYYRLIPEVRDDLCAVMAGKDMASLPNRTFRKAQNYYRLSLA